MRLPLSPTNRGEGRLLFGGFGRVAGAWPAEASGGTRAFGPAPRVGAWCGIYARSDSERGVHKAPANEIVRGAIGLKYNITRVGRTS